MEQPQPHLRPVDPPDAQTFRRPPRQRPSRGLPTDRLKIPVQFRVLETFGRLSGPSKRSVPNVDLSRAVGSLSDSTVSLSHAFFAESGWLDKQARGEYVASDALVEYTRRAAAKTPNTAAPLRAAAMQSWYWEVVATQLQHGDAPVSEIVVALMREAGAGQGHDPQIKNLLEWLRLIGLITLSDDRVSLREHAFGEPVVTERATPAPVPDDPDGPRSADAQVPIPTTVAPAESGAVLSVDVSIRVMASDLAQMPPEQIKSLFEGIGAILAAKHAIES